MNATAAYRPRTPIDETAPYRADEDSARGGGEAAGIPPMHDLDSPRPPAGRFAFGCGDRPLEGYTIKRAVGRGGFEVDGRPCVARAPLTMTSSVLGEGFSFSLEPLGSSRA